MHDDFQIPIVLVIIPCIGGHTTVHTVMFTLYVSNRQYPVARLHLIISLPLDITRRVTVCCTGHYYIGPIRIGNRVASIDGQRNRTI